MPTEAETRRRKKQDATRKRVAFWLDPPTAAALDEARGDASRAAFLRLLLSRNAAQQRKTGRKPAEREE
jgi:hypothetical protein